MTPPSSSGSRSSPSTRSTPTRSTSVSSKKSPFQRSYPTRSPFQPTNESSEVALSVKDQFASWWVNSGWATVWLSIYMAAQVAFFAAFFQYYMDNIDYSKARSIMGISLPIARGAAGVLYFDCGMILLTMCRNFITLLRQSFLEKFIPFDEHLNLHMVMAGTIVFWTIVHTVAHMFNLSNIHNFDPLYIPEKTSVYHTGPTITGIILVVCLFLMCTSSVPSIRAKISFEIFWYTHHLFVVFFISLILHGGFCFIKADTDYCRNHTFWKWFIVPGFIYIVERLYREYSASRPTDLEAAILHPGKVLELRIKKPSSTFVPGQYIYLNCPEIARFQWHPFTITSIPEEKIFSVHIRVAGNWTTALLNSVNNEANNNGQTSRKNSDRNRPISAVPERGIMTRQSMELHPTTLPRICLDGPYGAASQHVFQHQVALLVGAGIGITPFASILKSIWYKAISNNDIKLKKVYLFWICRDTTSFEWFHSLLSAIESEDVNHFVEIRIYLTAKMTLDQVQYLHAQNSTRDTTSEPTSSYSSHRETSSGAISSRILNAGTYFGRPNFPKIFEAIADRQPTQKTVGVFFCGAPAIGKNLSKCCRKYTNASGTKFIWNKENF